MITTISPQEDKLIAAARLMDKEQLNTLVDYVDKIVFKKDRHEPTEKSKQEFLNFLEELRTKVQERGLTQEILDEILADDE